MRNAFLFLSFFLSFFLSSFFVIWWVTPILPSFRVHIFYYVGWISGNIQWYNKWKRVKTCYTTSDTNYNDWQRMATSGTTNENDTVHFKEWMTAIKCKSRCTTSRDEWLQLELLNMQWFFSNKHTLQIFLNQAQTAGYSGWAQQVFRNKHSVLDIWIASSVPVK